MKVVAIIQARMGSTRLPGKMMLKILDKPVIQHVFDRVKPARLLNEIWLATTVNSEDDVLVKWAASNGEKFYRGSSDDVLDRYYQTAKQAKADVVVRITGDCPLADADVIDLVISEFLKGDFDFVCNTQPPTYPDGLDVEVFLFATLEKAWQKAKLKSEREHVTAYIYKHPEVFKIKNIESNEDNSSERWTLDTKEDFEFITNILEECGRQNKSCARWREVLEVINQHPEWRLINSNQQRNEGYLKSLQND